MRAPRLHVVNCNTYPINFIAERGLKQDVVFGNTNFEVRIMKYEVRM